MRFQITTFTVLMLAATTALADQAEEITTHIKALDTATGAALYRAVDELADYRSDAAAAVPALTELLADADAELRWRAARTLGAIGSASAPAVDALTKNLTDENHLVRAQSAYALGLIGEASRPSTEALVKAVTDEEALVRRAAITALHRIKPDRSVTIPLLSKLLEDAEPSVVVPVLHSLAEMGAAGVPVLTEALESERARYWAMLVLSEIGADAAPAVPQLAELMNHEEPEIRLQAILALGSIGEASKPTVPAIIDRLSNDDFNGVRYAAAYALGQLGDQSAKVPLQAALTTNEGAEGDKVLAITAAQALVSLSPDDADLQEKAVNIFVDGIAHKDRNVRLAAARALAQSKAPSELVAPRMVAAIADADEELIGDVIGILSSMGAAAVPRVKNGLSNEGLRAYAVIVLGNIGADAKEATPELIEALEVEGDDQFRREVLFTLGRIGPPAAAGVDRIVEILKNTENEEIRSAAMFALGSMGTAASKAAPALVEVYNDGNESQRIVAIWALLKVRPGHESVVKRAVPLLTKALKYDSPNVRLQSAVALGEIGAAASSSVPDLKLLLNDDIEEVRNAAKEAIAKIEK